jgi:hypothetical protein
MARTFLFFYVFTVPEALLSDQSGVVAHCLTVFVVSFRHELQRILTMYLQAPSLLPS